MNIPERLEITDDQGRTVYVSLFNSEIDGTPLVQIDTDDDDTSLRVCVNDGTIWDDGPVLRI